MNIRKMVLQFTTTLMQNINKKGDLKATFNLALMINECCLWGI